MTSEVVAGDYVIGVGLNKKSYRLGRYDGKLKSKFRGEYAEYYRIIWGDGNYTFKADEVRKITKSKGRLLEKLYPYIDKDKKSPLYYARLSDNKLAKVLQDFTKGKELQVN